MFLKLRQFRIRQFSSMKDAMKSYHEHLNSKYKEYKENSYKISPPRSSKDNFVSQDHVHKMHKEIAQKLKAYIDSYNLEFNSSEFIKLIGQVSYAYDNQIIVKQQEFQTILKQAGDNIYKFKEMREVVLFINFCFLQNIDDQELWFAAAQQIKNKYIEMNTADLILVLQSINKFNLNEFEQFFVLFEQRILNDIQKKNNNSLALQALAIYRQHDYGNESFFYSIKQYILNNLNEIKLDDIIKYLQYYGLGNETLKDKQEILNAILLHLYKMITFLNKKQLLTVYFIYVRTNLGTEILYRLIEERVALMIDEMQLVEIERLLIIAANQKNQMIFKYAENLMGKRLIDTKPQDMVQMAVLFMENNASQEFINKLEQHLIPAINTVSLEELPELIWALIQREQNLRWMEKIAQACQERVPQMNLKLLTSLVWMTSDYFKRLPNPQKITSNLLPLYEIIEKRIVEQFENCEASLRDIALVLNAYGRNLPISKYLVQLLQIYILNSTPEELLELDGWALSQILWGFNQIDGLDNLQEILKHMEMTTVELLGEMNINEMLTTLQVYIQNGRDSSEMVEKGIEKTQFWLEQLDLNQVYLCIHVFTNTAFPDTQGLEDLLKKLVERLQYLKSVKVMVDEDAGLREYELQQELEKYK